MISVLIADDQDLVREGLRMLLEAEPDIAVAGEAADGSEVLAQARLLDPDVILMDVRMPQMNGIEATTRLVQGGIAGPDSDADHLQPGRVRLPRAEGRRERLPAEGRQPRAAGRRRARGSRWRNAPRSRHHPQADRGLLPRSRTRHS